MLGDRFWNCSHWNNGLTYPLFSLQTGEKFVVSSKLTGFSNLKIVTDQTIYRLPDRKVLIMFKPYSPYSSWNVEHWS